MLFTRFRISHYIDIERLTHSIKTVIAALIGFILTKIIGFPADQWIVITIIVVMCAQIYVGSVLNKAYLRFLGTIIGCLFATIAIISFGQSNLVIAATIALSTFIFSYIATGQESMSYAGTLGAVTTVIIMLGQIPTTTFAAERFLEISIGILIATLISQFILPIHARTHLRGAQAESFKQLRDYYTACMITRSVDIETLPYQDLDDNIVKSLSKQRQLAKEAKHETLGDSFDPERFIRTLHFEKELLRSIDFMHHAIINIKNTEALFSQSTGLHAFNETTLQTLNTLITAIETDSIADAHVHTPSISALKEDLQKKITTPSREELIYIDGFLFSAEILTICLVKLATLYNIPVHEAKPLSEQN